MKNLAEVPKHEQLEFINSFDHVLSDLDGVIWLRYKPLPGAPECINTLKQLGKKITYVSNNSTHPREHMRKILEKSGINTDIDDVALPILAIISHLKKINFDKELYVIGVNVLKEKLRKAGISLAEDGPAEIEETLGHVIANINDNKNVGGVLLDFDVNVNFVKLQKAVTYLKREDCIFIAGAGDAKLPIGNETLLIGPHYFMKPIIDVTGRQPLRIAKPHLSYNEFITEKYNITDPQRVLFMGDSVIEDLNFATSCGYQKLLVLSGLTTQDHVDNWEFPEEYKPQYYVESLRVLKEIISNCLDTLGKL